MTCDKISSFNGMIPFDLVRSVRTISNSCFTFCSTFSFNFHGGTSLSNKHEGKTHGHPRCRERWPLLSDPQKIHRCRCSLFQVQPCFDVGWFLSLDSWTLLPSPLSWIWGAVKASNETILLICSLAVFCLRELSATLCIAFSMHVKREEITAKWNEKISKQKLDRKIWNQFWRSRWIFCKILSYKWPTAGSTNYKVISFDSHSENTSVLISNFKVIFYSLVE